jgi:magnesium chelatase family protein
MEAMLLHSVAGEDIERIALGERPFRSPHHSISLGGLLGGGRPVRPGELSLAHRGVLFLDELPEFAMNVLQSLRQPLEDHEVKIERVEGSYRFPCDFQLIAAANPCPCGHLGDIGHPCTCPSSAVERYQGRIGGPLMDRIDILVDVARPSSDRVIRGQTGMATEEMRRQVVEGRAFARERCLGRRRMHGSSPVDVNAFSPSAAESFESSARNLMLGGRAIDRVARVARTIADLAGHAEVMPEDVSESLIYRTRGTR